MLTRRQEQAMKVELARVTQYVERAAREALAELDLLAAGGGGTVLEAHIAGDQIIVAPLPRLRVMWRLPSGKSCWLAFNSRSPAAPS
jgi:hypothetical protein